MKRQIITDVVQQMLPHLDNAQLKQLQKVLECTLFGCDITKQEEKETTNDNPKLIDSFISAKRIEGCSEKTLKYYRTTIETMELAIDKSIRHIQTEDLRSYLTGYQSKNQSSRVTIDNIRRILSSFFSWLEDEDYILKSPVRRIHKVKTATNIKETYTDEELEKMRDNCTELRDLAIIDMLASTGMRIGEMVLLNKADINFNERECVVFGKGDKERSSILMQEQKFICRIISIVERMIIQHYSLRCVLRMRELKLVVLKLDYGKWGKHWKLKKFIHISSEEHLQRWRLTKECR